MNGKTLERLDVAAYLDAVRSELADLPAEERDDLVADVEASLLESGEPPTLSPQEFAAELREAAGLEAETHVAAQTSPFDALRVWLSSERVASWRRTARELAPIWWLVRAYVAVAVLGSVVGVGWPLGPETGGSIVALLVAATLSIWLGLRGRRGRGPDRRIALAANIVLALALWPVAALSLDKLSYGGYSDSVVLAEQYRVPGLAVDGVPVLNLYAFSREGAPLFDVLLYDESGQPISLLSPGDTSRRVLTDENGTEIFNSYPIRYFEPGTRTVAQPGLAPPITVPQVATPPLELPPR